MNWMNKVWVMLRYRKQIMKHIIVINNLKMQIQAEWEAIKETIDEIIKEGE